MGCEVEDPERQRERASARQDGPESLSSSFTALFSPSFKPAEVHGAQLNQTYK